jgi:hypothetical protein
MGCAPSVSRPSRTGADEEWPRVVIRACGNLVLMSMSRVPASLKCLSLASVREAFSACARACWSLNPEAGAETADESSGTLRYSSHRAGHCLQAAFRTALPAWRARRRPSREALHTPNLAATTANNSSTSTALPPLPQLHEGSPRAKRGQRRTST